MTGKIHIVDGEPRKCTAKTPETCRAKGSGGENIVHYNNVEEYYSVVEKEAGKKESFKSAKKVDVAKLDEYGTLSAQADFDNVFAINEDGTYAETSGVYCDDNPVYNDDTGELSIPHGWEIVKGFSGQEGIDNGVMHDSETLSGGLEKYVRENPGTYVVKEVQALANPEDYLDYDPDEEYDEEYESVGWAVLRRL